MYSWQFSFGHNIFQQFTGGIIYLYMGPSFLLLLCVKHHYLTYYIKQ